MTPKELADMLDRLSAAAKGASSKSAVERARIEKYIADELAVAGGSATEFKDWCDFIQLAKFRRMADNAAASRQEKDTAEERFTHGLRKAKRKREEFDAWFIEHEKKFSVVGAPPASTNDDDVLVTLIGVYQNFFVVRPEDYIIIALWTLHTWVYRRFAHTPRLIVQSPAPATGKSRMMVSIKECTQLASYSDDQSIASFYHIVENGGGRISMFMDEFDEQDVNVRRAYTRLLNAGYTLTGKIDRVHESYSVFAPLCIGGIDVVNLLRPTTLTRCIVINCGKATKEEEACIKTHSPWLGVGLDELRVMQDLIRPWALAVMLDPFPDTESVGRAENKWRVLFAIADSFGEKWGAAIRQIAEAHEAAHPVPTNVQVLADVRDIFIKLNERNIWSKVLIDELRDTYPGVYMAWQGPGRGMPHPITQAQLANVLRMFGVKSQTVRMRGRDGTANGYKYEHLDPVWAKWLDGEPPPAPPPDDDDEAPLSSSTTVHVKPKRVRRAKRRAKRGRAR
jgi:hypothetical protein